MEVDSKKLKQVNTVMSRSISDNFTARRSYASAV